MAFERIVWRDRVRSISACQGIAADHSNEACQASSRMTAEEQGEVLYLRLEKPNYCNMWVCYRSCILLYHVPASGHSAQQQYTLGVLIS